MAAARFLSISLVTIVLAGCGRSDREVPRGIGEGRDDLKRSPCACLQIDQQDTPDELKRFFAAQLQPPV